MADALAKRPEQLHVICTGRNAHPKLVELADLVIRIEATFHYPCDIEWARKDGKWYILQCRPITTLDS